MGDKVERIGKIKRIEERPRKPVPIVEVEDESENEERWGFEDYSEQPVLSPIEDEAAPAHIRGENRGKQRAKT